MRFSEPVYLAVRACNLYLALPRSCNIKPTNRHLFKMINNLINIHDFVRLFKKMKRMGGLHPLLKIIGTEQKRVKRSWSQSQNSASHWWDIPEVVQRWNKFITGSESVAYQKYVAHKYFHRKKLNGLSIGCGTGYHEIEWVRASRNLNLTGFDISEQRIREAKRLAFASALDHRLKFIVGDAYDFEYGKEQFDVIIAEGALHHLRSLDALLPRIKSSLKRNGILIVNEYVGRRRFQWTDRQMEITNAVLLLLPPKYRIDVDGHLKKRIYRPGRLSMWLNDPSEAAESDMIEPLLEKHFRIIEKKPYGGTILQNLLKDIAHNFLSGGDEAKSWLDLLFRIEDYALGFDEIRSDFIFFVCRKG